MVPLYCFDPRQYIATPWGNPKTGGYRAQFLLESVQDLKQSLRHVGSDLMVFMGTPEEAVQGLSIHMSYANVKRLLTASQGPDKLQPVSISGSYRDLSNSCLHCARCLAIMLCKVDA